MALTAVLTGTFSNPELRFEYPWGARMPKGGDVTDWVKKLPGRRWDRSAKVWYITGIGIKLKPDAFFAKHGIEVDFSEATGTLEGLTSLQSLWRPLVKRSNHFPSMALVRHRLAGYEPIAVILGPGAVWDKKRGLFTVQLADLVDGEARKRGLQMDDATYEAAIAAPANTGHPRRRSSGRA